MHFKDLFRTQKELDDKIIDQHSLQGKNLVPAKLLALQVELGELANETRCFKFWSRKGPSPRSVILEEYVDCLHFILSIGLDNGFTNLELFIDDNKQDLIKRFQEVFRCASLFGSDPSQDHYHQLFETFLRLGKEMGYTWDEIYQAYLEKNEINHQRQKIGY